MVLLEYKDWKKRLPFDNIVYKDVKRYTLRLNTLERELMNVEIDFYRSRFSLEQIMTAFRRCKKDSERETFIKAVLKRSENILYLPDCLVLYYKKRIKKEFPDYRPFLEMMLEKANKQRDRNPLLEMYKVLLGKYYRPIMRDIDRASKGDDFRTYSKKLKPEAYEAITRDYVSKLKLDTMLGAIFGRCTISGRLPLAVVDDIGEGEWISKNVSYATDKFFLYTNKNSLTEEQLEHSILYNVYPGKAQFYNTMLSSKPNICFDNGASILIEGWADYATCHSKSMAYSYSKLAERCIVSRLLLKKKLKKAYERVWVYLMGKYPKDRATQLMVDVTQYPGNYLSSVIGHFGISEMINHDFAIGPRDLLDVLSSVNCGDYLAIYHPSVQRQLVRRSITAKVSPHILSEQ